MNGDQILFKGNPDQTTVSNLVIPAGKEVALSWSTTFAGEEAYALIGKTAGAAQYKVTRVVDASSLPNPSEGGVVSPSAYNPLGPTPVPTYTYTLNFDANHAEVTGMPGSISVTTTADSQSINTPDIDTGIPALANRTFIGWIQTPTYTKGQAIYYPGDVFGLTAASPNVTLYAYWQTAVATLNGTDFVFDMKDVNYAMTSNDYYVDDTTHVDPGYKANEINPILAFFLDIAYAEDDKYPTWHEKEAESNMTDVSFTDKFNV